MITGIGTARALVERPVGISLRTSCRALAAMLLAVSALLVLSAAVLATDPDRVRLQHLMALVALVAAVLVLTCWRRMPSWTFFGLHAAVSAALALVVHGADSPSAAVAVGTLFALLLVESFFVLSWLEAGLEMALGLGLLWLALSAHPEVAAADRVLLVGVVATVCVVSGWLVRAVDRADVDVLTSLPNRRGVQRRGEALRLRSQRRGTDVVVALVDVDWFKEVNDTLGHAAGDDLLRTVARLASISAPEGSVVGRWGGDEFALLLAVGPADGVDAAVGVVADVRALLPEGRSVSAGVAPWRDGEALLDVLQRADEALYRVKRAGRGTTCVDGEPEVRRFVPA